MVFFLKLTTVPLGTLGVLASGHGGDPAGAGVDRNAR
jgi:hypothetical protein